MVQDFAITGVGIVSPFGVGSDPFRQGIRGGIDAVSRITSFDTQRFKVHTGGELKNFQPQKVLGLKGLRNLNRSTLFLLTAAQEALSDANIEINDSTTDNIGVCTGTTFSHIESIVDFDREVFEEGIKAANPAIFPSTVLSAASSQVSIRFNIQGFNATISTGYTSSLEALKWSIDALETEKAEVVLSCGVETLNPALFFGFHKLGYMAGIKGIPVSCPFDRRRNGPLHGEGAVTFCVEKVSSARKRGVRIYAKIKGACSFFDAYRMGKICPGGEGVEKAIQMALDEAGISACDVDYISSCANSSQSLDKIEVKVLKRLFGKKLNQIPVSSIKSMIGETCSVSGALQIASCIYAMEEGVVPPTINYKEKDPECDIDCVPNKAQAKEVNFALVTNFGPGGYNSACVLEKYTG